MKYKHDCEYERDIVIGRLLQCWASTYTNKSISETQMFIRDMYIDDADYLPPRVREQTLIDRHIQIHSDIVNVNINKYGKIKNFSKNY